MVASVLVSDTERAFISADSHAVEGTNSVSLAIALRKVGGVDFKESPLEVVLLVL